MKQCSTLGLPVVLEISILISFCAFSNFFTAFILIHHQQLNDNVSDEMRTVKERIVFGDSLDRCWGK